MLGLRTTIYLVEDIDKAKTWYSSAFKVEPYFNQPFYVGYNIGGYELGLLPNNKSDQNKSDNVLSYWGVEQIEASYQYLIELGATPHEPPNNVGGELMVASVRDPWGNVIGLIYNPDFKLQEPTKSK